MTTSLRRYKLLDKVQPIYFIAGLPSGLPVGTPCEVHAVTQKGRRLCVKREDGQPGFWWVDADDVEPVA